MISLNQNGTKIANNPECVVMHQNMNIFIMLDGIITRINCNRSLLSEYYKIIVLLRAYKNTVVLLKSGRKFANNRDSVVMHQCSNVFMMSRGIITRISCRR